jgi:hypothetical protein
MACSAALHHMQRGALARAGFGHHERAVVEAQHCECMAGRLALRRQPLQPPGNHQVEHEVQRRLRVEVQHHALAHPAHIEHGAPDQRVDGRHSGAQDEDAAQLDGAQRAAHDLRGRALHIDGDVGQLGHGLRAGCSGVVWVVIGAARRRGAVAQEPSCGAPQPSHRRSHCPSHAGSPWR